MKIDPTQLRAIAEKIVSDPTMIPNEGKTFCNFAVYTICDTLGCKDFWDEEFKRIFLANEMVQFMSARWVELSVQNAIEKVNAGTLVVAGQEGSPHGHVCVCLPDPKSSLTRGVYSGKWDTVVPLCVNVGISVYMDKGTNFAFITSPRYFAWPTTLTDDT